jgi:uncharacterized Zn-finger protein
MVAVNHVVCPKCKKTFYIHKDVDKDFVPFCPFCKHVFKLEEAADIWVYGERRGWQAAKLRKEW